MFEVEGAKEAGMRLPTQAEMKVKVGELNRIASWVYCKEELVTLETVYDLADGPDVLWGRAAASADDVCA